MNQKRAILSVILTAIAVFVLSLCAWFKPETLYSDSERRALNRFPELSVETLLNGQFSQNFESYTQDQFPFRDAFRTIKANTAFKLFQKSENNDLFIKDNMIFKLEYPLNEPMLNHAINKFEMIYDTYLKNSETNVYFSIIPDKNYYLEKSVGLKLDYQKLFNTMIQGTPFMEYIDITELLTLSDFYRTDTHWRQEAITDVAETLLLSMNTTFENKYTVQTLDTPFYGVYYGQSALQLEPDNIQILTNETMNQCEVISYNTGIPTNILMYDFEKAKGKDAYELYLNGADAFIEINNPNASTEKELILFRDSFGSSLAPLMISGYKKITLIDIRYIQSAMLGNLIDFNDQDVLFIYSTLLLNNSLSFK